MSEKPTSVFFALVLFFFLLSFAYSFVEMINPTEDGNVAYTNKIIFRIKPKGENVLEIKVNEESVPAYYIEKEDYYVAKYDLSPFIYYPYLRENPKQICFKIADENICYYYLWNVETPKIYERGFFIFAFLFGILLIADGVRLILKKRKKSYDELKKEEKMLIVSLGELDKEFLSGKIKRNRYLEEKNKLTIKLKEVRRDLEELERERKEKINKMYDDLESLSKALKDNNYSLAEKLIIKIKKEYADLNYKEAAKIKAIPPEIFDKFEIKKEGWVKKQD